MRRPNFTDASRARGRSLGVLPGEGKLVARLMALMVVTWSGFAIGGNTVEGLLLTRVGPSVLPYLFVGLGVATAVVMLGVWSLRSSRLLPR